MSSEFPPLTAFMPHRAPMLLLDALEAWSENDALCTKTIRQDDLFVENGRVSAWLALELFAQAAAAHFGYLGYSRGGGFAAGALLGTRKLELDADHFAVGDRLAIRVNQVMSMPPAAQYECVLRRGAEIVASGTITVALGDVEER